MLIAAETAGEKSSAGAARQYSGTAGGVALCQVAVTLTYATSRGHALIDDVVEASGCRGVHRPTPERTAFRWCMGPSAEGSPRKLMMEFTRFLGLPPYGTHGHIRPRGLNISSIPFFALLQVLDAFSTGGPPSPWQPAALPP